MENLNREASQNQSDDFWQAKVQGQIYDTNFAGITGWINEGAIQASDKVRCGKLGWIEAGKIPAFLPFFNAKGKGVNLSNIRINHIRFYGNDQERISSETRFYNGFYGFIYRLIRRVVSH